MTDEEIRKYMLSKPRSVRLFLVFSLNHKFMGRKMTEVAPHTFAQWEKQWRKMINRVDGYECKTEEQAAELLLEETRRRPDCAPLLELIASEDLKHFGVLDGQHRTQ